ncbi:MAG: hypothetical protein XD95_0231 [Microgenomates bacterium 39_7]|nr:MAG: hypothetical protein XD95_0231 [Microgenomates bacterium 39_7]
MRFLERMGVVYGEENNSGMEIDAKIIAIVNRISSICQSLSNGSMSLDNGNHLQVVNSLMNLLNELENRRVQLDQSLIDTLRSAQQCFLEYSRVNSNDFYQLQRLRRTISTSFNKII